MFCLHVASSHPIPPGQECSKGKWPLAGAWRFFCIFVRMSDEKEHQSTQWERLEIEELPEPNIPQAVVAQGVQRGTFTDERLSEDLDKSLATADPLLNRPRISSTVLCAVFAVLFLGLGFGAYWAGVHTVLGQSFEDQVFSTFASTMPPFMAAKSFPFGISSMVIIMSVAFGAIGVVVALVRRRWRLLVQLAVFAALAFAAGKFLKPILPRPFLINTESAHVNSAPSGHTILAAAASLMLVVAVPRVWRAVCALIGAAFTLLVGLTVIIDQWHRPVDVIMGVLLAGGLMLLVMAFTGRSGMDRAGTRRSSASVQIVATALIAAGVCAWAYAAYVIWQISLGLTVTASWTAQGADNSTTALVVGTVCVVFGLTLTMRQLTASPLSKMGLIGQPPTPPKR